MTAYWLVTTALLVLNLAVIPYFLYLLALAIAASLPRRVPDRRGDPIYRFLIAIPAHDEETVIATAVRSCLAANYPASQFSVVVIADNCTDQTAALAASAGARVVERFDDQKKSKGYAIEYLIETLKTSGEMDALGALVIIDADTSIDADLLLFFDHAIRSGHDWIQAYYTVANPDESWRTRLLKYALSLFNGVMPLGQNRLGASAAFKGNGMCFSAAGLKRVPWRSYGLVEDMEFAWTLRLAGEGVLLQPDVSVYGAMLKAGGKAAASQRRRWEFGRSEVRKKYLGPVLFSTRMGWWEKALSLCELTIPPLGVLAVVYLILVLADSFALLQSGQIAASPVMLVLAICLVLMTASFGSYAISPFLAMRLEWKYALSIVFFPAYVAWKLFISIQGRPDRWVRTARESPLPAFREQTDQAPLPR